MALKRKEWAGILVGIGATVMSPVFFSSDLERRRFYAVVVIAASLYSGAAYLLGWLKRAPFPIGDWLKKALVLGSIWFCTWAICYLLWQPPRSKLHINFTEVLLDKDRTGFVGKFYYTNTGKIEISHVRYGYLYQSTPPPRLSASEEDSVWAKFNRSKDKQPMTEAHTPVGEQDYMDLDWQCNCAKTIELLTQKRNILYLMYYVRYEDEYGEQETQYCGIYRWQDFPQQAHPDGCYRHNQD